MPLPLIPIFIGISVLLAIVGFATIWDYLSIMAAIVGALYIHLQLSKNKKLKYSPISNIILSIVGGLLLYKMFFGITLFIPIIILIFATPPVIEAYITKRLSL